MKLACSSSAFDALFRSAELTQPEWIELCARELAADAIVLDVRHFPRTDSDYLAQVKKMCVDAGLCVAAIRNDRFFCLDPDEMQQNLEIALAAGAPILASPLALETSGAWTDALERIGTAATLAKRCNVTLALRNAPGTFAAGTHGMKRVTKEADSAWMRYGPEFCVLEAGSDPKALLNNAVLIWQQARTVDADAAAALRAMLQDYRGCVALDADGDATVAEMQRAASLLRA